LQYLSKSFNPPIPKHKGEFNRDGGDEFKASIGVSECRGIGDKQLARSMATNHHNSFQCLLCAFTETPLPPYPDTSSFYPLYPLYPWEKIEFQISSAVANARRPAMADRDLNSQKPEIASTVAEGYGGQVTWLTVSTFAKAMVDKRDDKQANATRLRSSNYAAAGIAGFRVILFTPTSVLPPQ
jgi:hypothetical protein